VITAIHGMLLVVRGVFIKVNYLLGFDSEVLVVCEEGLFECVLVYNAWVYLK